MQHLTTLPLATIEAFVPAMVHLHVSEVARSPRGFLTAFRAAGGHLERMSPAWQRKRLGFIARHMAQLRAHREPLFTPGGAPTRRHLALIAWAYSPVPDGLEARATAPRRLNGPRAVARAYVKECGWKKIDARAITGKKWRPSMGSPRRALSPDARRVFVEALASAPLEANVRRALALCYFFGLRVAEAVTSSAMRFTEAGLRVFGKGSKWRVVPYDVVPTTRAEARALALYVPVAAARVQRACRRLAAAHPELRGLTPHVLRHTFATAAVERCVEPRVLQAALGHDKFATTLVYLQSIGAA